jgi:hypothetical protein
MLGASELEEQWVSGEAESSGRPSLGQRPHRSDSTKRSIRRSRVCAVFAASMSLTCLRRRPNGSRSKAARTVGAASRATFRSAGSSTSRGSVSSSSVTSISSPSSMPAAARFAALMPTRYRPPFDATRLRHVWPFMVIATFGRFPSPSAPTTSAGTSAPVALPAGTTVERKVSAVNVLSLRDADDVAPRVEHDAICTEDRLAGGRPPPDRETREESSELMKTMTCKQPGGPCDHRHQGQDADEVIKAQDRHLKEMVAGGDTAHASALKEMKGRWKQPISGMGWYRAAKRNFAALPED